MQSATLWDVLGIEKTASDAQIKRAYRQAALRTHPDKNGSAEEFEQVKEAFEILSDARLRQVYESRGLTAARQTMARGAGNRNHNEHRRDPFAELFSRMGVHATFSFGASNGRGGGGGFYGHFQQIRRARAQVTLEQLYNAEPLQIDIPPNDTIAEQSRVPITLDSLRHFMRGTAIQIEGNDKYGKVLITLQLQSHPAYVIAGEKHLIHVAQISLCEALTGCTVRFCLPDKQKTLAEIPLDATTIITPETQIELPSEFALKDGWRISLRFSIEFPKQGWSFADDRDSVRQMFAKLN